MESRTKEFLPIILPQKGDKDLEESLIKIALIHSNGKSHIGVDSPARKWLNQKPFKVLTRLLYVDDERNYHSDVRRMIEVCLDPFIILVRDKNAELLNIFFIPEGYPNNPYIRFLEL